MKLILLFVFVFIADMYAQVADSSRLAGMLKTYNGALVIYGQTNDKYIKFNLQLCKQRCMPASTFKIPNALIGLETGVIPDSDYVIKWDGKPQFSKEWERDHTLKSAIYYSVVPYFRELARRVGREKMQYWLNKINYGNKTIGEKEDYFWLDNSLKISADEQVEFLKKLYFGKLPFSNRSMDIVKDILPRQDFKNAVLRWKTGTGNYPDAHYIAWLVGYVEKEDAAVQGGTNLYFFAFHLDAKMFDEAVELRNKIKSEILEYLGVDN